MRHKPSADKVKTPLVFEYGRPILLTLKKRPRQITNLFRGLGLLKNRDYGLAGGGDPRLVVRGENPWGLAPCVVRGFSRIEQYLADNANYFLPKVKSKIVGGVEEIL